MNLLQYQTEAQRTKSDQFYAERVSANLFIIRMTKAVLALQALDEIKKALFYGKQYHGIQPKTDEQPATILPLSAVHWNRSNAIDLVHAILGKVTESGELLELLLNALSDGMPLDPVKYVFETGDGFWYDAIGLAAVNCTFASCAGLNHGKLQSGDKARYKAGFTSIEAINRNETAEQAAATSERESAGAMLQRLGTDAHSWAREFVERSNIAMFTSQGKEHAISIALGWFANAIMAGYDKKAQQVSEGLPERVDDEALRAYVYQFIGWLSGDIQELNSVEVPRLAASFERFLKKRQADDASVRPATDVTATPCYKGQSLIEQYDNLLGDIADKNC